VLFLLVGVFPAEPTPPSPASEGGVIPLYPYFTNHAFRKVEVGGFYIKPPPNNPVCCGSFIYLL